MVLHIGEGPLTAFFPTFRNFACSESVLAKYALGHNLGIPLSDEFQFKVGDVPHLGQVWSLAVVYVKIGDWGNVRRT